MNDKPQFATGQIFLDGKEVTPRYVLVHSHQASLDANDLDPRAHCFGPFDTYDDLVAFDQTMPRDACYRFAIPIAGPEARDLRVTAVGVIAGGRPAARMLPPREPELTKAQRKALKIAKRARKAAKRAAEEGRAKRDENGGADVEQ